MINNVLPAVITAAIAANGYALVMHCTRPFPQPIITIQGEQTHYVKALTLPELHRRIQYMGQRGWKCRTAPSAIAPFAIVIMYRPAVLRNGRNGLQSIEEKLQEWEFIDAAIMKDMKEPRKRQTPSADKVHSRLLPHPLPSPHSQEVIYL